MPLATYCSCHCLVLHMMKLCNSQQIKIPKENLRSVALLTNLVSHKNKHEKNVVQSDMVICSVRFGRSATREAGGLILRSVYRGAFFNHAGVDGVQSSQKGLQRRPQAPLGTPWPTK